MKRKFEPQQSNISPPPASKHRLNALATNSSNSKPISHSSITVYSWNVNGITPFLQPSVTSYFTSSTGEDISEDSPKASLRDFFRRHGWPEVLFLQEVKINPNDTATIRGVERAVRRQSSESPDAYDYEAHFCLPSDKFNARGFGRKVYGVCSIIRKDFSEHCVRKVRPVTWDAEGRVLVIEIQATNDTPKLAIFNIYAVNGTEHPYKDPESGQTVGTRHDRKLKFHALLRDECRELARQGFGIMLAGDMNIARSRIDGYPNLRTFPNQHCVNRADFETKFFSASTDPTLPSEGAQGTLKDERKNAGLAMIDTFRHLHPDQKAYTYYPRSRSFGDSCDRVDMILVSDSLKDNLKEAGMHETPGERGPSDHVPLYARFDFDCAAGNS